jgi:hypothetical protein
MPDWVGRAFCQWAHAPTSRGTFLQYLQRTRKPSLHHKGYSHRSHLCVLPRCAGEQSRTLDLVRPSSSHPRALGGRIVGASGQATICGRRAAITSRALLAAPAALGTILLAHSIRAAQILVVAVVGR